MYILDIYYNTLFIALTVGVALLWELVGIKDWRLGVLTSIVKGLVIRAKKIG